MSDSTKSFWQTAPGVITAMAALITALGGLLAVLLQNGVLGDSGDDRNGDAAAAVSGTPGGDDRESPSSAGTSTDHTDASTLIPWAQATATLTRQDGTEASVKAATVGLACGSQELPLNGQRISLQLVRSIRFQAVYPESASADAVVMLLDGRRLADSIDTRNCPVSASNELGPLQIELDEIKRIDFDR